MVKKSVSTYSHFRYKSIISILCTKFVYNFTISFDQIHSHSRTLNQSDDLANRSTNGTLETQSTLHCC